MNQTLHLGVAYNIVEMISRSKELLPLYIYILYILEAQRVVAKGALLMEISWAQAIDELLQQPRVTLYSGENFTGAGYELKLNSSPPGSFAKCVDLDITHSWTSIQTHGTCIRLFSDKSCHGESTAIYPGSSIQGNNITTSPSKSFLSLGPCLRNEFDYSAFYNTSKGVTVRKNHSNPLEIPDVLNIDGYNLYSDMALTISNRGCPIRKAYIDDSDRLAWLYADIYGTHVGSKGEMVSTIGGRGRSGYSPGYVIPSDLGGPDSYVNTFLQSRRNLREWSLLTDMVAKELHPSLPYSHVLLWVTFSYENEHTSTPLGFYYYSYFSQSQRIIYGFVRN